MGLALLLTAHAATGSYAIAGATSGVFGVANVVASPTRARLVDRWGQRVVLCALALGFAMSLVALAAVATFGTPVVGILLGLALVAGLFAPPLGAAMRVIWARLVPDDRLRAKAYALDSVSQEVLFTTGPLLIALLAAVWSAAGALVVTAALALVGAVFMTSGAASREHVAAPEPAPHHLRPFRQPAFRAVGLALLGVGLVLGVVQVAAPAAGSGIGGDLGPGILLAVFSASSALGGLAYGHRHWAGRASVRLLALGALMALSCGVLILVPGFVGLGVGLFVVGGFLAPSFVTGYVLADHLTDPRVRTEASTWIDTAVNSGAAIASAGAGVLIDRSSTGPAFLAGGIAALLCLGLAAPALVRRARA